MMDLTDKELRRLAENVKRKEFMESAADQWGRIFSIIEPQDKHRNFSNAEYITGVRTYEPFKRVCGLRHKRVL